MKKSDKLVNDIVKEIKKPIKKEIIKFLPTGITLFNLASGGGEPVGKIINIVGDKSSGKTILTIEILAHLKKILGKNLKIYYDDCESGFAFDDESIYGTKIFDETIKTSETVEDFQYNLDKQLEKIKKDETLVYVVDSLDGLSSEAELERIKKENKAREKGEKVSKGTYAMEKQKKMSEIFRVLNNKIKNKNCILIIISQVRENIGVMFGKKYRRSGGKALDFYASQCIWLSECEKMTMKNRATGIRIKLKFEKNKVGCPFRASFLDILFDYGVDNVTSNVNYFYDLLDVSGKIKDKEKKIKWCEKDKDGIMAKTLVRYIEKNNLESELEQRVIDKWNKIEESISSKNRKKKY